MPLLGVPRTGLPDEDVRYSLGTAWAVRLVGSLNRAFPEKRHRADVDVQSEIKVLEELLADPAVPPAVTTVAVVPDRQQVIVTARWDSLRPAGVVTLVTPRLKANPRKRAAFVSRCLATLANAGALVVIDAAPGTHPSPCAELASALDIAAAIPPLAVLSFRTVLRNGTTELDVWVDELTVGSPFPTATLALRGGPVMRLDLEATYMEAVQDLGL